MIRALAHARVRLPRPLARLIGDRRGVSAVEFALVAPLMVTLYLGVVEISDAVAIQRKVTLTAAALANLPAQVTTISSSDMTNILNAASAIIVPYAAGNLSMSVSCLSFDANKNMTVKWTALKNAQAPSINVDSALKVASSQLIYAEVSYAYTPIVGHALTGNLTIKDHMYMSPRISAPTYNSTACS
jgi:Flp pilus assembly protein TadG